LDDDRCYRALLSRDSRFDGRFFTAVKTTGIYCRPICPAPAPKRGNVRFFACAAAAEAAGFRACRRCRPETSPETPAWQGTSAVVSRALRLLRSTDLEEFDVEALAARLGVGARQLRRLFARHLGASPMAIVRAQRLHFARVLLDETDAPVHEVALGAGFRSVRQFNHAVRAGFGDSPSGLRRGRPRSGRGDSFALRLAFRPPLDWEALLRFLAARAIPGVEAIEGGRYRRAVEIDGLPAALEVELDPGRKSLVLRAPAADCGGLLPLARRARRLFDLDADPSQIGAYLRQCPRVAPLVSAAPGLRVPGAWDSFELATRAILGQQVSVAGATTLAGRLVGRWGRRIDAGPGLTHLFPSPDDLAEAELEGIGLPRTRAAAIRVLAGAMARGELALDGARGLEETVERLCALPGLGPWTAHYIAMRACGEPDAFPANDLGLRQALGNGSGPIAAREVPRLAETWRPWRAYAAMHLWNSLTSKERP
jgi:AraC family transcriptional regulator of adaptative response / DNA-3-methyladenine glycosylase II